MDVDPLADTPPPRHVFESDDEDEYNPLPTLSKLRHVPAEIPVVAIHGKVQPGKKLVVVSGEAGRAWAAEARLGDQVGGVYVNNGQIATIFLPEWTEAIVVISEVSTRLPVWAMYPYAKTITEKLQPPSVALLDTYALPAYIPSSPPTTKDPPVRFLRNTKIPLDEKIEPFQPPNLINSTSAAFTTLPSSPPRPTLLLLLPSKHIPPPPPPALSPLAISQFDVDEAKWSRASMGCVHRAMFGALGEDVSRLAWGGGDGTPLDRGNAAGKRRTVGDGGMYI